MSAISRTQAWCKLAVLIAEGLPAPKEIRIAHTVLVTLNDLGEFDRWRAHFDAHLDEPFIAVNAVLHEAMADWHGYRLSIVVHVPYAQPVAEPVTEDMRWVRHVAAHGEAEALDPDPVRPMNDTVSLDDDVHDDEPAGAVSE